MLHLEFHIKSLETIGEEFALRVALECTKSPHPLHESCQCIYGETLYRGHRYLIKFRQTVSYQEVDLY